VHRFVDLDAGAAGGALRAAVQLVRVAAVVRTQGHAQHRVEEEVAPIHLQGTRHQRVQLQRERLHFMAPAAGIEHEGELAAADARGDGAALRVVDPADAVR